jgi:hypothetical protein
MSKVPVSITKIEARYENLLKSFYFRNFVKNIREKFNIKEDKKRIPKKKINRNFDENLKSVWLEVDSLCDKCKLNPDRWSTFVLNYIYYGVDGRGKNPKDSLCFFSDIKKEHESCFESLKFVEKKRGEDTDFAGKYDLEFFDKSHPIVLRISPETEIENIIEYVKSRKKIFRDLKKNYKNKIKIKNYTKSKNFSRDMRIIDLSFDGKTQSQIKKIINKEMKTNITLETIRRVISSSKKFRV